ncbi:MAG: hypothetical protein PF569_02170 [Candidatus Woesearchaeota archaeon]|jgi:hypothetical protein|nr:hypothetical protein [Candidatus Woesearchaeota archaeon]
MSRSYREIEGNSEPITLKVSPELLSSITAHCKANDEDRSSYIRELIKRDLDSGNQVFTSGINEIRYMPRENKFKWSILLDNPKEQKVKVSSDIELDFLENLYGQIRSSLEDYYHNFSNKKEKSSIINLATIEKLRRGN